MRPARAQGRNKTIKIAREMHRKGVYFTEYPQKAKASSSNVGGSQQLFMDVSTPFMIPGAASSFIYDTWSSFIFHL
jgi:hypothetical protein